MDVSSLPARVFPEGRFRRQLAYSRDRIQRMLWAGRKLVAVVVQAVVKTTDYRPDQGYALPLANEENPVAGPIRFQFERVFDRSSEVVISDVCFYGDESTLDEFQRLVTEAIWPLVEQRRDVFCNSVVCPVTGDCDPLILWLMSIANDPPFSTPEVERQMYDGKKFITSTPSRKRHSLFTAIHFPDVLDVTRDRLSRAENAAGHYPEDALFDEDSDDAVEAMGESDLQSIAGEVGKIVVSQRDALTEDCRDFWRTKYDDDWRLDLSRDNDVTPFANFVTDRQIGAIRDEQDERVLLVCIFNRWTTREHLRIAPFTPEELASDDVEVVLRRMAYAEAIQRPIPATRLVELREMVAAMRGCVTTGSQQFTEYREPKTWRTWLKENGRPYSQTAWADFKHRLGGEDHPTSKYRLVRFPIDALRRDGLNWP